MAYESLKPDNPNKILKSISDDIIFKQLGLVDQLKCLDPESRLLVEICMPYPSQRHLGKTIEEVLKEKEGQELGDEPDLYLIDYINVNQDINLQLAE